MTEPEPGGRPEGLDDPDLILPEDEHKGHRCALPGAATVPRGTLARCSTCGRWSYSDFWEGWGETWFPVCWFHFRMRRRIREREGR